MLLLGALLASAAALAEEKPQPETTVDLKHLGSAPDLFTDQSDSAYPQRGVISLFWRGEDRIAIAFSTNRRWKSDNKPEPLAVSLLIFDRSGKQLAQRQWNFSSDGTDGDTTLDFEPGPDNSILAIHESNTPGTIPEGNFIQVLNPDTSLRQNFYVPAISAYVPGVLSDARMPIQTFYADKHASITWWGGRPLKPGLTLALPPGAGEMLAGPGAIARAVCPIKTSCTGVVVVRPQTAGWKYTNASADRVLVPRFFLNADEILIELRQPDQKQGQWIVARSDGSNTTLPALAKGLQPLTATGISTGGRRLALIAAGESGLCGSFDLWCKQRGAALVIDLPGARTIFEQEISTTGGVSALSPDGKHLAIFDRNKLIIYAVP